MSVAGWNDTRSMTGKRPAILWVDQYGDKVWARTAKELRERCGGGKCRPIYCDNLASGKPVQVGYSVGKRWFNAFMPMRRVL